MKDYYKILEVGESATLKDIKKSYKRLIKRYHPDLNSDNLKESEEKTKELNEAYSVLKDNKKRREYDLSRQEGNSFFSEESFSGFSNLNDLFNGFNFGFDKRPRKRTPERGEEISLLLFIDLKECIKGTEKAIKYKRLVECPECKGKGSKSGELKECPECKGSGYINYDEHTPFGISRTTSVCHICQGFGKVFKDSCSICKGEGVILVDEELSLVIPRGACNGLILRVRGKGNKGRLGGDFGDLLVKIELKSNDLFKVDGLNILLEVPVSMVSAILGDKISVPLPEGDSEIEVSIPEGTEAGTLLRIKRKGIPKVNSEERGDYYLVIKVLTPRNLSEKQKEILREFNECKGEDLE